MKCSMSLTALLILSSCTQRVLVINNTNCNFIDERLKSVLVEKKMRDIVNMSVYNPSSYGVVNEGCVGLFGVAVNKWKGVKTNLNSVSFPILIWDDKLFINDYYINGKIREGLDKQESTQKFEDIFFLFKEANSKKFKEKEMQTIYRTFKYGIEIFPKGRLRN